MKCLGVFGAVILVFGGFSHPSIAQDDQYNEAADFMRNQAAVYTSAAQKITPAVVAISSEMYDDAEPEEQGFFASLFGSTEEENLDENGNRKPDYIEDGSGFIVSEDGIILTNNHVVGGAGGIEVTLVDGRVYDAELIGTDPQTDIGVIKLITDDKFPFASFADSDSMEIGEPVLALGSPLGFAYTLTAGIISAKDRNAVGVTKYEDFIQTDAAITPGNSGGPLINLDGEVVGINTAIVSDNGGIVGISFAIPINMALIVKDQLVKDGKVTRGFFGLLVGDIVSPTLNEYGVNTSVTVSEVVAGSPADQAGIESGDIIAVFDDDVVRSTAHFRNLVAFKSPGYTAPVIVTRNGEAMKLEIIVGKRE